MAKQTVALAAYIILALKYSWNASLTPKQLSCRPSVSARHPLISAAVVPAVPPLVCATGCGIPTATWTSPPHQRSWRLTWHPLFWSWPYGAVALREGACLGWMPHQLAGCSLLWSCSQTWERWMRRWVAIEILSSLGAVIKGTIGVLLNTVSYHVLLLYFLWVGRPPSPLVS